MVMLLTAESSSGQDEMVGAPGLAHSTTRLVNSEGDGESPVTMIPIHPLGIKPAGNAYTSSTNIRSTIGAFITLPDELIIRVLDYLDAPSLLQLGTTCKALYAFCRLEDLWKALFIGPFLCAHTPLQPYTIDIPFKNQIPRLPDLSAADFSVDWTGKPFILTDVISSWPVYRDWSTAALLRNYGELHFRAEAVDWPLKTYVQYMNNNEDESPLYLFDRTFVEKMEVKTDRSQGGHYWAPECFGEDLLSVLGNQRPDSRWLIVGPERSGSTFHKDPNATSAWNAVLRGSKYWIMFPASSSLPPPPGVFVSEDQSEVTSPLSIAEWLLGFHKQARGTPGCLEGVCGEGEVLHVPSGWWHLVVNLSPSIAITQNFVPRAHLSNVLSFLRDRPEQVSGFRSEVHNPYEEFVQKMREQHPEMLDEAYRELERTKEKRKRKWDEVVQGDADGGGEGGAFSFGFGFGDVDGDREEIL
ncbi:hypothetical protein MMC08_001932 [Hypocenomyce scalaris]|nr:hypothetical protein [Hypocenomyce scalaris]